MTQSDHHFKRRTVLVDGETTAYRLFEPDAAAEALPLILFLHGAGESGRDDILPTTVGLGPAIVREPQKWPALVVFPQASRGYGWRGFNLAAALAALDDVEESHAVDPTRVYVTGISMGGYGTWLAGLVDPERFAALAPVCGGLDATAAVQSGALVATSRADLYAQAAKRLSKMPQWVFHGDADDIIPVQESRAMVQALRSVDADVRYTEYANVRHNSWDAAYAESALPEWLLGCAKPAKQNGAG